MNPRRLVVALATMGVLSSGCLIIPTPAGGGRGGVITRGSVEPLGLGVATRTDVLLRLGNPAERLEGDRFFVYRWERIHGLVLFLVPGFAGSSGPIWDKHYLGLEFTTDGHLKRFQFFDPSWFGSDVRESLRQWMEQKADLADR
jgi:hypothetical protein